MSTTTLSIVLTLAFPSAATPRSVIHPSVQRRLAETHRPVNVWVFLTDKGFTSAEQYTAAMADVANSYDRRAVRRRILRRSAAGLFDARDLPVNPRYIERVVAGGASRRVVSKWLNALSVTADVDELRAIAALPFVRSIELVRRGVRTEAIPIRSIQKVDRPLRLTFHGLAEEQLQQIGILDMFDAGFTGSGVVIGILDTGFKRSHEAFHEPGHELQVIAEHDFVDGDDNAAPQAGDPESQHRHGTMILGSIGAYKPDTLVAGAFDASFVLTKTEDVTQEVPAEEDAYVAGLEFIEANGGDLSTSSLGYIDWYTQDDLDGQTAVTTIGVNTAIENGLVCITAAGNGGHDGDTSTLLAPADAFEVIACGAVNSAGESAGFSSRGPTADGRVKPEVLARGVRTRTIHPDNDADYTEASGTSLSTPLVASAVALLIEAHPEWTVKHIRRALFRTADYFVANGTYDPAWIRGFGIINVFDASQILIGDINCDGTINAFDIEPFLLALFDPDQYPIQYPDCDIDNADINGDGPIDAFDIEPFLALLFP